MRTAARLVLAAAVASSLPALANPVFTFKADKGQDRPVISELRASTQGTDLSLEVLFNRAPFGLACGRRCANATLFIDADDNPKTGVQFGKTALETGADLAIVLQGSTDYRAEASPFFRVKVRPLPHGATALTDDEPALELDHRKDSDRLKVDADTAFVLLDASALDVKWGKQMRIIYHPPASKPAEGKTAGFTKRRGGGGKVEILQGSSEKKKR